jgi:hypothetical protein
MTRALDHKWFRQSLRKRGGMTRKGRNSNGGRLGRKEVTMLGPFEVDNIRRGGRARKVVHAFVKACM